MTNIFLYLTEYRVAQEKPIHIRRLKVGKLLTATYLNNSRQDSNNKQTFTTSKTNIAHQAMPCTVLKAT